MKLLLSLMAMLLLSISSGAQGLKGLIKNAKDSSGKTNVGNILGGSGSKRSLTSEEIISGLKEALQVGTERSTSKLSAADGFFKDAAIKILMPAEAQKAERTLRNLGMGKQVDNAILSMNRAAEDAAKSAAPIFIAAVKGMSFTDAMAILRGGDFAATTYLSEKTTAALTEAFRPAIESSLQKVDATKYWNTVFTSYNKVSAEKVNPDLVAYVTEKALTGIFHQLA
ncbi:MAG TPA: DUF4197 domain-containing protein, partial [Chitinophagaceae bacterium]|nr:DUF4197 domain-containing protein [Chitinophagaceae bacterium]